MQRAVWIRLAVVSVDCDSLFCPCVKHPLLTRLCKLNAFQSTVDILYFSWSDISSNFTLLTKEVPNHLLIMEWPPISSLHFTVYHINYVLVCSYRISSIHDVISLINSLRYLPNKQLFRYFAGCMGTKNRIYLPVDKLPYSSNFVFLY